MVPAKATASLDATGLESHHISRHFLARSGRTKRYRRWVKLAFLCDNGSHLIAGARVERGPSNDSPVLPPVARQAAARLKIDCLLADAAFDAEAHHRLCREELGIRRTVIPLNRRGGAGRRPASRYRREMSRRFPRRAFGQRWQAESVASRLKRRLGAALTARTGPSRNRECWLRVLTHDLMLLRRAHNGFYRANSEF